MTRHLLAALAVCCLAASPAWAGDIVADWGSVKMPPPPALKPVKIETGTTALLVLDFDKTNCTVDKRPRCFATVPKVAKMLDAARSHGVAVAYSVTPTGKIEDFPATLAAKAADPVVRAGVDKFIGTDLDTILKARGIKTVIVTGVSAHGATLYTASAAAQRGYAVIVPVDGMAAEDLFGEVTAAWLLVNAPASVSTHVTLTRSDMIGW